MKTLKNYIIDEASILDIDGSMEKLDKFEKDIENFDKLLSSKSLKDFNKYSENFLKVLDTKRNPKPGDFVARVDHRLIRGDNNNKKEYIYSFTIGYRGKKKIYTIYYSPWVNQIFIDVAYYQVAKPYNMENSYYGIIPEELAIIINKKLEEEVY